MFCGEDIPLFGDSDMGINLGGVDGAVSQHFLNEADIYARFQKTCGEGVAEHVGRDVQINGNEGSVLVDHPADCLVGERFPGLIGKEMAAGTDFCGKIAAIFVQYPNHFPAADLNAAFLTAFAIDQDCAVMQIDILTF